MAAFIKFHQFPEDVANKIHDLLGTNDTLKAMLTNTPPVQASNAVKADIVEIPAGFGYSAGGADIQNDGAEAGGVVTVTAVDVVWTAAGGSIGPFRYAVIYNDTPTAPVDPLLGYYDYGSAVTVLNGETFTLNFGTSFLTVS